jgi:hypothetical protein
VNRPSRKVTKVSYDQLDYPGIPSLDELLPSLDRTGRRGRLTNKERAYLHQRAAVQAILDRLATAEQQISADKAAKNVFQRDLQRASLDTTYLKAQLSDWEDRYNNEVHNRRHDIEDVVKILLTVAQLTRLTGIEFKKLNATIGERGLTSVKATFQLGDYQATVVRGKLTLQAKNLPGLRKKKMDFGLNWDGSLPVKDAMAILTFLGIQRDPKEAYSEAVYKEVFGTDQVPGMLDTIEAMLGSTALRGAGVTIVDLKQNPSYPEPRFNLKDSPTYFNREH